MVHLRVPVGSATVHRSVQLVGIVPVKTRKSIPWSRHVHHSGLSSFIIKGVGVKIFLSSSLINTQTLVAVCHTMRAYVKEVPKYGNAGVPPLFGFNITFVHFPR